MHMCGHACVCIRACVCVCTCVGKHVCVCVCVCIHMLALTCMHDFCVCVVSFPGVQKCGEEEEELRKELEEYRRDLNGKVLWSGVFQQFIYICVIVKCRVYYS